MGRVIMVLDWMQVQLLYCQMVTDSVKNVAVSEVANSSYVNADFRKNICLKRLNRLIRSYYKNSRKRCVYY